MNALLRAWWTLFRNRELIRRDAEAAATEATAVYVEQPVTVEPPPPEPRRFDFEAMVRRHTCPVCEGDRPPLKYAHEGCWSLLSQDEKSVVVLGYEAADQEIRKGLEPLSRLVAEWPTYIRYLA